MTKSGCCVKSRIINFITLVFFILVFVGCGGGSGSGSEDELSQTKTPDIPKTANALTRDVYLQMQSTDNVTLLWKTKNETKSQIIFSTNLNDLDKKTGVSSAAASFVAVPSIKTIVNNDITEHHEVLVSGLESGKRYYYVIGDSKNNFTQANESRYFETLALPEKHQNTRVWVLGNTSFDKEIFKAVKAGYHTYSTDLQTNLLLLLGNNVLQNNPNSYDIALFKPLQNLLYNTTVWPALGLFEAEGIDFSMGVGDAKAPYFTAFKLPQRGEIGGSMSNTEAYYSFNRGETHFISINTLNTSKKMTASPPTKKTACISSKQKFIKTAWPIFSDYCIVCHKNGGVGPNLKLTQNNAEMSYRQLLTYASTDLQRQKILSKSIGELGHAGGNILGRDSQSFKTLQTFMPTFKNPIVCAPPSITNQSASSKLLFNTAMIDWIKADLASSTQKWKVVYMHHGPYSKGSLDSDADATANAIRKHLVPIFDQYNVDLVISGQSHSYERSYLLKGHTGNSASFNNSMKIKTPKNVYPKQVQSGSDQGVTYVVAGTAAKSELFTVAHPVMPVTIPASGSVILDIVNNRLEVLFIDDKGRLADDLSITKGKDLVEPRLMHGRVKSANRIALIFNERLSSDVGDESAYTLSGPDGKINIYKVSLSANQRVIVLNTDELPVNKKMDIVIDGVSDLAGNMAVAETTIIYSRFKSNYKPPIKLIPTRPKPPVKSKPPIKMPAPVNKPPVAVDDQFTTQKGVTISVNPLNKDSDPDKNDKISLLKFDARTTKGGTVKSMLISSARNIAAEGNPTQSNTLYDAAASRAIDGNTDGKFNAGSVTHTANGTNSWWQLSFAETKNALDRIVLFNRSGKQQKRLSNFRVSVFNGEREVFGKNYFKEGSVAASFTISLPTGTGGDRIRIALNGKNNQGDGVLSLAEVQVWIKTIPSPDLEYTPAKNFTGIDSFKYTITDTHNATDTATVTITVKDGLNQMPTAENDTATVRAGESVTVDVLRNDVDADNDTLLVASVTQGNKGTVKINANGTLTYTARANTAGSESFTYTVTDGNNGSATAIVNVTITIQPNQAPTAVNDTATVKTGESVSVDVLRNDADADNDTLLVASVTQGSKGKVKINTDATLTYTARKNATGNDSFTYTVSDGKSGNATATVFLLIQKTVVPVACVAKDFYANTVKADIGACFGCHKSGGIAGGTSLIIKSNDDAHSLNALKTYGNSNNNIKKLLNKTIGVPSHGGGNQFSNTSSMKYKNLKKLLSNCVTRSPTVTLPIAPPIKVPETLSGIGIFKGVTQVNTKSTLRKSAILMAGRLPTTNEYSMAKTEVGMRQIMRELMSGERFAEFIKDTGNRLFLTAGVPDPEALVNDFSELKRLKGLSDQAEYNATIVDMRSEPLELLRFIVENDRSYKEVLSADYTMVTKRLQKSYGAVLVSKFKKGDAWAPAKIKSVSQRSEVLKNKAYPHAGVLTTAAWLSRFPTTESNRNRHRTAKFFDQFLGVDLESFGQRPIDDSSNDKYHVPTMEDPNCLACHSIMDPVAGAFANWGTNNQYWQDGDDSLDAVYRSEQYYLSHSGTKWHKPGDSWYRDVLLPGFEGKNMPGGHGRFSDKDSTVLAPISRNDWLVIDSTDTQTGRSWGRERALDDNKRTFWLSVYQKGGRPFPHHFTVDMGEIHMLGAVRYLPRRGDFEHIKRYEIRVSTDGKNWTRVAKGAFTSNDDSEKHIEFSPTKARYFELRNLEPFKSKVHNSSIAELYAFESLKSDNGIGQQNGNGGIDRLQWLAREAVEDKRFTKGAVRFWYTGIFGHKPLTKPQDTQAQTYSEQLSTYNTQEWVFEQVAKDFSRSGFKVKDLLVSLMSSELFRSNASNGMLSSTQAIALKETGLGRLMSPAEINAKVNAVMGQKMFDDPHAGLGLSFGGFDGGNFLLSGIKDITPAVLSAYEIAMNRLICDKRVVISDLALPVQRRIIMRFANAETIPESSGEADIKRNIQYLIKRFIGQDLAIDHQQITITYELFKAVYQNSQVETSGLRIECERGINTKQKPQLRAWNAVLAYLITDFRFISK